ncbi:helix-turn-helix domain-containing protein [Nocardiopsis dassonvillei]|uniref:helix-turn-helix domain-containing protein n=1 Tax=Nocardiopsis dassonvillei TaxID=2014 RepID=UPI0020A40D01|nr:helix-turn-helix domain-containing protein [Nocardiopsis dassonvillei]MCP3017339.1 helix-turn-helix domain-containing protein [Nocardiopsis dassonvillei]
MSIQHMQIVFDAGGLTAPQKAVLLAYCNFTDAHGYCWPGVERIADMTGLSVSGVKKVRKQLIEATLLTTVSRGKKGGGRITNASRINVKRLQKMARPARVYDDNVMPGLGFEEDNEPEETGAKVPEGHTNGSPEAPQRYLGGTNEGTCGDPYPSVDPSADPSGISSSSVSGHAEPEPAPVPEKKTKTTPEAIVIERTGCTDDEARMVVDYIEQQGDRRGGRIRSLVWWVTNREERLLLGDLAHVRRHSAAPTVTECADHHQTMPPHGCGLCAGEIKAGDPEDIARLRAHLAMVGEKARPDLARLLGAPQVPAQPSAGGWTWEDQLRRERAARGGYTPYKNPENQDVYDEALL